MGEHGHVGKRTNARLSTHIPMMVRLPGVTTEGKGMIVPDVVESIDLYPTLAEAAVGETMPECFHTMRGSPAQDPACTEGRSLLALVKPKGKSGEMTGGWRNEAFIQESGETERKICVLEPGFVPEKDKCMVAKSS